MDAGADAVLDVQGLVYQRPGSGAAPGSADDGFAIAVPALRLQRGEVLGIVGPSGCGKSTLIDLLALLRRPAAVQHFRLQGHDVAALWQRGDVAACTALRAHHVGVVLQTGGLLPSLPVRDNVMLSQQLLGRPDPAWADALLAALDLRALGGRLPGQLSIGQRQRVAVARALAHRPALVLADEPTASLGLDHGPAALDLLLALARDSGAALVLVSHDVPLLQRKGVPLRACRLVGRQVQLDAEAA